MVSRAAIRLPMQARVSRRFLYGLLQSSKVLWVLSRALRALVLGFWV